MVGRRLEIGGSLSIQPSVKEQADEREGGETDRLDVGI